MNMPTEIESLQSALTAANERIAELERALETHPCHTEKMEFDHDWKFVDDSFDHEYGTEVVHYFECRHCKATKDVDDEYDCTIDGGM